MRRDRPPILSQRALDAIELAACVLFLLAAVAFGLVNYCL